MGGCQTKHSIQAAHCSKSVTTTTSPYVLGNGVDLVMANSRLLFYNGWSVQSRRADVPVVVFHKLLIPNGPFLAYTTAVSFNVISKCLFVTAGVLCPRGRQGNGALAPFEGPKDTLGATALMEKVVPRGSRAPNR
jgi:hypothetical protein